MTQWKYPNKRKLKGGKGFLNGNGYRIIFVNGKRCFEHRYVMEQKLNRPLKPFPQEVVHHINKNRTDNRPENLKVISSSQHQSYHNLKVKIRRKTKECSKCHKFFPFKKFSKRKAGILGLRSDCKSCQNITNLICRRRLKAE